MHVSAAWVRWVEVHPETAAKAGIRDGDLVRLESAQGAVRLPACLSAGTHPDVVNVPLFGGEGPNQNDLIANETDPFRGFGLLNTTRVRIGKA